MSDGTANIYYREPETFAELARVQVTDGGTPVLKLNELEYIDGEIYANVWQTDFIARIEPDTGVVNSWIDLKALRERVGLMDNSRVLNGIAYDDANDRLYVTGKQWPVLFEIELVGVE